MCKPKALTKREQELLYVLKGVITETCFYGSNRRGREYYYVDPGELTYLNSAIEVLMECGEAIKETRGRFKGFYRLKME